MAGSGDERQGQNEARGIDVVLPDERAAMRLHDGAGNDETDPHARPQGLSVGFPCGQKRIGHFDADFVGDRPGAQRDRFAGAGRDGVAQQVHKRLRQFDLLRLNGKVRGDAETIDPAAGRA